MGKPVVVLGDALYAGSGCCYEPAGFDEVAQLVTRDAIPAKPIEFCLPTAHFLMTHGTRYVHYRPKNLFEGTFLNDELSPYPPVFEVVRAFYRLLRGKRNDAG